MNHFSHRLCLSFVAFSLAMATADAQLTVTLSPSKDNTLYQDPAGGLSNGAGQYFFTGLTNSTTSRRRGVLAFDVAAKIPAGSKIVSAALTINMSQTSAGAVPVALHALSADWGEGTSAAIGNEGGGAPSTIGDATWVHRAFNTKTWTTLGGDFAATPSATLSVGALGLYTWASTAQTVADVQGWLDNPTLSYGWLLLTPETTAQTAKRFDSKENTTPANRPRLVVTYNPKASVVPTGTGCVGSSAKPLVHAASGAPALGNATFALTLANGPANAPCALIFAAATGAPIPLNALLPTCVLYLNPAGFLLSLSATLNPTGGVSITLPIPNTPSLAGGSFATQLGVGDAQAPGILITSNALTVIVGV